MKADLIVNSKCEFLQNRLEISPDCTHNEWVNIGKQLKYIEGAVQFWIGDWARFGERYENSNNVKKEVYDELEEITGFAKKTLKNYKTVSDKVSLRRDSLPFSHHAEVASLEPEKQEHFLKMAESEKLTVRELKNEIAQDKRKHLQPAVMPEGQYDLIYADPPWQYDFAETDNRKIENHYETMTSDDIKNMTVPSSENCLLLLWATAPKLKEALEVIDSWGFEYKTHAIWNKEIIGMGYWFRGQHELLLVATKGNFSPPQPGDRVSSIFSEKRQQHSRKPEIIYEYIEKTFSEAKKLELFSRQKREGWSSYGNETA